MLDVSAIQTYLRHLKTSVKIIIGSFLLGILSALPINLYIAIGPEDGKPLRMIGTHTDISSHKHSQAQIFQSGTL